MTIHLFAKDYPYISFEHSSAGPEDKSFGNLIEIIDEPGAVVILNCNNKRLGVNLFAGSESFPFWVVEQGSRSLRKMNAEEKELFLRRVVTSLTKEQYALVLSKFQEIQ